MRKILNQGIAVQRQIEERQVSSVAKHMAIGAGGEGFESLVGQIGQSACRKRRDVSLELCCPAADSR